MAENFEFVDAVECVKSTLNEWVKSERSDDPGHVGGVGIEKIHEITVTADDSRSMQITADGLAELDPQYSLTSIGYDVLSYSGTPPLQQKLKTHKFSKEITETTSTTTTKAFKVGGSVAEKITMDVKIPFIGEAKSETTITVTGEYSWSSSATKSVSQKVTYEMPSQEIVLNPGDKYEIKALLYTGSINGKTLLKLPVTGRVHFVYGSHYDAPTPDNISGINVDLTMGEFARKYGQFSGGMIQADPNDKDIAYIIGSGTITVPYAVKTELTINKLTDEGQVESTTRLDVPFSRS